MGLAVFSFHARVHASVHMNICLFFSAETIKYFYGDGGVGKDFFGGGGVQGAR